MTYRRTEMARQLAQRLLRPSALDEGLRSGLFLSGPRRIGKSTFLMTDLVPTLAESGAVVIYVDLWSNMAEDPARLVHAEVRAALKALSTADSGVLQALKKIRGLDVGLAGFKFGFKLDDVGKDDGPTLAHVFAEVIRQAQTDVVLIIDEVQQATTSASGDALLYALKAARDQVNLTPGMPGKFLFLGTGSHRARVAELTARRNAAFNGAVSLDFPLLGDDFVDYTLQRVAPELGGKLPSLQAAASAFKTLGNRPEEFNKALAVLRSLPASPSEPDREIATIAATLRASAADAEIDKLTRLGPLAIAIFDRVVRGGENLQLFSSDAAEAYSASAGRQVQVDEIQPVMNQILAENILMRRGHGQYQVTDHFVQEIWLERAADPILGKA